MRLFVVSSPYTEESEIEMVCSDSSPIVCAHSFVHTPSKHCDRQNRFERTCFRQKHMHESQTIFRSDQLKCPRWCTKIEHTPPTTLKNAPLLGIKKKLPTSFSFGKKKLQKRSFLPSQNTPESPGRLESQHIASLCPRANPDSESSATYTSVHLYPPLSTSVRFAILRMRAKNGLIRETYSSPGTPQECGTCRRYFVYLFGTPRHIKGDEVFLRFHTHMNESYTRVRSYTKKISRVTNRRLCANTSSSSSHSWRQSGHC